MENSFVGEVEVNPRKLLEDGLRKEMVQHISELMNSLLQFDFSADSETTASITKHYGAAMRSMTSLASRLEGFQGALCCIEDYTSINSLKIWHSEMSRIINYNVEQEVNKYLLKKVLDSDSKFQSKIIPIPRFPRTHNEPSCINFMGRVLSMLLKVTDAHFTTFSLERSGWFLSDGFEVCGLKTMLTLRKAIGINGLAGLERLLCYRILHELHRFVKFFRTNVSKQAVLLEQLRDDVSFALVVVYFLLLKPHDHEINQIDLTNFQFVAVPGMENTTRCSFHIRLWLEEDRNANASRVNLFPTCWTSAAS